MDYLAAIYNLSSQFYIDYPTAKYPEIAAKKARPYSCLILDCMDEFFICIPFRSNVKHKYAYHFQDSARSKLYQSGLDYTKVILIKDANYLDSDSPAIIDQDEYKEAIRNLPRIVQDVHKYIVDYSNDLNGVCKLHPKEWQRRYGMSTLPYFDTFLRIAVTDENSHR